MLASRCIDGVVVIADAKITGLGTLSFLGYRDKLSGVIRNVIFGCAGSEDGYQIFVRYVVGDMIIPRDDKDRYTYQNMIQKFCDIMDLMKRFHNNPFILDVIVARLFYKNEQSDLFPLPLFGGAISHLVCLVFEYCYHIDQK